MPVTYRTVPALVAARVNFQVAAQVEATHVSAKVAPYWRLDHLKRYWTAEGEFGLVHRHDLLLLFFTLPNYFHRTLFSHLPVFALLFDHSSNFVFENAAHKVNSTDVLVVVLVDHVELHKRKGVLARVQMLGDFQGVVLAFLRLGTIRHLEFLLYAEPVKRQETVLRPRMYEALVVKLQAAHLNVVLAVWAL